MYYAKAQYTVYVWHRGHEHPRGIPAYTASEAKKIAEEYSKEEGCHVSIYDRSGN